jgi:ABC-2 type transport system ATP-binding protein
VLKLKADGKSVLLSSHIMSEVERLADKISIIRAGEIVACDTLENLIAAHPGKSLEDVFLKQYEG